LGSSKESANSATLSGGRKRRPRHPRTEPSSYVRLFHSHDFRLAQPREPAGMRLGPALHVIAMRPRSLFETQCSMGVNAIGDSRYRRWYRRCARTIFQPTSGAPCDLTRLPQGPRSAWRVDFSPMRRTRIADEHT
jgi:hypothetical protein